MFVIFEFANRCHFETTFSNVVHHEAFMTRLTNEQCTMSSASFRESIKLIIAYCFISSEGFTPNRSLFAMFTNQMISLTDVFAG